MILGTVVGTIWATKKNPWLQDLKLVVVRPRCWYNPAHEVDHLVAVDRLDARVGQDVVVCFGWPGRNELGDGRYPVEASVAAIVDGVEMGPAEGVLT
ncbi:MAG: EutN/CcmL family microcompartment protein [Pseudomonadota bacterium]